jgi:putative ATP-dependent endonuclease of the OLD family
VRFAVVCATLPVRGGRDVFLESLSLTNFRSFSQGTVRFNETLTVIAGENNAGKTNVLDAVRLLTTPTDGRQTRWPDRDDVRRGAASFSIAACFGGLDDRQRGSLITALATPAGEVAQFGLTFTPSQESRRGDRTRTIGPRGAYEVEPRARDLIRHVHLPALRDATRELASSSPGRIEFLLRRTTTEQDRKSLVDKAKASLTSLSEDEVIRTAESHIQSGFGALTQGVQPHNAHLNFAPPDLRALARDLRFQLSLAGLEPTELSEAGLGYANLLFLSTVLVELAEAPDADLTLFLVEEPEAHLHPQLQSATLAYLRQKARESRSRSLTPGSPAGHIQVVVSTHSPNLTAAVGTKHLFVLRSSVDDVSADESAQQELSSVRPRALVTRPVAIARLGLRSEELDKVDRYLNVTRSAFLFARRVLLVEGIAEALLAPAFGKLLFTEGSAHLARLHAATIVAIDGVDFSPYVKLLLSPDPDSRHRAADRVIVLTDEDPRLEEAGEPSAGSASAGQQRAGALRDVAATLGAPGLLTVELSPVTLEASLFGTPVSHIAEATLKATFLTLHPQSGEQWERDVASASPERRGTAFVERLKASGTRKGDFAQELARGLPRDFPVPPAFSAALTRLVEE